MLPADKQLRSSYGLHQQQKKNNNNNITSHQQPHQLGSNNNTYSSAFDNIATSPTNHSTAATFIRRTEVLRATTQIDTAKVATRPHKRYSGAAELREAVSKKIAHELKTRTTSKCIEKYCNKHINSCNNNHNNFCCSHNSNNTNKFTYTQITCGSYKNKRKKKTEEPDYFMGQHSSADATECQPVSATPAIAKTTLSKYKPKNLFELFAAENFFKIEADFFFF
ncbi:uncharacterized protein [Eurosta solidaginis]|uniref:uncharacterized protein n=1 Tax=Eurosta solidaginis TaxID=178769 RepID=UPI0035310364